MTVEKIYAIVPDSGGWRKLPSGSYAKLGDGVQLGDGVRLGNYVRLGDNVRLGGDVQLGDGVQLGDDVRLGNYVRLGNGVRLGDGVQLGDYVRLGDGVRLGNYVHYEKTPYQILCHPYVVYPYSLTHIGVGCVVRPIEYWQAGIPAELVKHEECNPWIEYQTAIESVIAWINRQKEEN